MPNKKNIIIVGYPKSGTTWLSKLVAELINCPLKGNWGFSNINDGFTEGDHRISNYNCYKSHHSFNQISKVEEKEIHKIIYIIRDPRDVVISGLHFFNFSSKFNKIIPNQYKKKKMINAILNGDKKINDWLSLSWEKHVSSYFDKNILFLKYEDLLDSPLTECKKIFNYIDNIEISKKEVLQSIKKQSFNTIKAKKEVHNLRIGSKQYWKKEFTKNEKILFINSLKTILHKFEYLNN